MYQCTVNDCLKHLIPGTMVIICSESDDGTEYMYGSVLVMMGGACCCSNVVYPLLERRVIKQFIPSRRSNMRYVYIDHIPASIYNLEIKSPDAQPALWIYKNER